MTARKQNDGVRRAASRAARAAVFAIVAGACAGIGCESPAGSGQEVGALGAATQSFQDGVAPSASYTGSRATYMMQSSPASTHGTSASVYADGDDPTGSTSDVAALLSWDIASIPAGSTVRSVTLTFAVTSGTVGTFEIYALRRAWDEVKTSWSIAGGTTPWQTPGALGADDRDSTVLGTVAPASTGTYTVSLNAAGLAVVQGWVDDPSRNYGFVVANSTTTDGIALASDDSTTLANRPRLSVGYDPPGASDGGASDTGPADSGTMDSGTDAGAADAARSDTGTATDAGQPDTGAVDAGSDSLRFAVIGDFGQNTTHDRDVANLVKSWNPALIITAGDNNYPDGAASTIDVNIGSIYHDFIGNYAGSYGAGSATNRFFPTLGNHDYHAPGATPYLNYFTLPNNERYYDFVRGPVHFFAIDSDSNEPDGTSATSIQGVWLRNRLAASTARWKIVYFHFAPYSSGSNHGSNTWMQWPFAAWGANVVIGGHDHVYERIVRDGIVYFVNGTGGAGLVGFSTPVTGSQARISAYGAQRVTATQTSLGFEWLDVTGAVRDTYTLP